MEAALNHPPAALERVILFFIPPAAREALAGDLWERYRGPHQYALEGLSALPFVIASQARRNVNLPVAGLQCFLAFDCFGGFATPLDAFLPTLAVLAALLLQAAYQGLKPPSASRAALETVLVAGAFLIVSSAHGNLLRAGASSGWPAALWALVMAGSLPLLSLFRAQLFLISDQQPPFPDRDMTADDIRRAYAGFARDTDRRNRNAAMALLAAALLAAVICGGLSAALAATGFSLAAVYASGGFYLMLAGRAPALPAAADFLSLRALYSHELARQNQLCRFMWWLWLTPLLSEIYVRLIGRGVAAGQPLFLTGGILAAALLCFLVMTINSERSGRIQENITLLARMRERKSY